MPVDWQPVVSSPPGLPCLVFASGIGVLSMAKKKVSATELVWIFKEKLDALFGPASGAYVAIVPSDKGWKAIVGPRRRGNQQRTESVELIQKQLRKIYVLEDLIRLTRAMAVGCRSL